MSSILSQEFLTRSLSHYTFFRFVLLQSLVVQFSMTNLLKPLKVTASLLYHKLFRFVKYFFQLFKTFFEVFVPPRVCDPVILPHLFIFVNTFFEKNSKNFKIFSNCKSAVKSYNLTCQKSAFFSRNFEDKIRKLAGIPYFTHRSFITKLS